ncbi:MAG: VTT domain-containing protein [Candidatus Pacebacteria bacterium]|nr:VTT domain-containing protein [Candidatus Paceibacterota bacterium]
MIEWILSHIGVWVSNYGALGVFGASVIEEVISIIPSALVQLGGGFFILGGMAVSAGTIGKLLLIVALPAAIGVTVGSLVFYAIGYWGGEVFLHRFGKYVGVRWSDVLVLQEKLEASRWDDVAFFAARAFPLLPSVVLAVFAGVVRMSLVQYSLITIGGVFVRATILGAIGWQLGSAYESYAVYVDKIETVGLVVIGSVIIFFLYKNKIRAKK